MKRFARALLNYFVKGLIVVLPMGAAIYFIYWGVSSVDNALNVSGMIWPGSKAGKPLYIPGLGIANVLLVFLLRAY